MSEETFCCQKYWQFAHRHSRGLSVLATRECGRLPVGLMRWEVPGTTTLRTRLCITGTPLLSLFDILNTHQWWVDNDYVGRGNLVRTQTPNFKCSRYSFILITVCFTVVPGTRYFAWKAPRKKANKKHRTINTIIQHEYIIIILLSHKLN